VNDIGTGLTVVSYTQGTYGSVVVNTDGTYIYTSVNGFSGIDTFNYVAKDSADQTVQGMVTVYITPIANPDTATTEANTTLNGASVLLNDIGTNLIVSNTQGANGTVVMYPNGTYIYTPVLNFSGIDTFTYTAVDGAGQTAVSTVTITVTPSVNPSTDTTLTNVPLNSEIALPPTLTLISYTQPSHGAVVIYPDNTYLYTPAVNFSGVDSFTYTAEDSIGQQITQTVTIYVLAVTYPDEATTTANLPISATSVLANDFGTGLTIASYTQGSHGSVLMNADGTYTYTPALNFSGTDSFTYIAQDSTGQQAYNIGVVTLNVLPIANTDSGTTQVNTVLNGSSVLTNDIGVGLFVITNTQGTHGFVTVNSNGTYVYNPVQGYSGLDSFTYTVQDADGERATGVVNINITPIFSPDSAVTNANTPVSAPSVFANDATQGLTVASYTQPTSGSVSMAPNGTYTYTPQNGFSGSDTFTYTAQNTSGQTFVNTVTITVLPVANSDSGSTSANTVLNGSSVLINDLGTNLTIINYTQPAHGSVTVASNGTYTYTPALNFSGSDLFNYTAQDTSGQTTTSSVNISVLPVSAPNTGTTTANTAFNGSSVLANDSGSNLLVVSFTQPSNGSVVINIDGTYTYTPNSGFSGIDTFNYTAQDSANQSTSNTVTITVTPTSSPGSDVTSANTPVNGTSVLTNDVGSNLTIVSYTQGSNGTVVMANDGSYTYTPQTGFSGVDTFSYTAQDAIGQTTTNSVTINVMPTSLPDSGTTTAGSSLTGASVLANDVGSNLVITSYSQGSFGSVVMQTNGTYTYTPQNGFSGYDSFMYVAQDAALQTTWNVVNVQVTPVAVADSGATVADTQLVGSSVLANDIGTNLIVSSYTQPAYGSVTVASNGTYIYLPAAGFSGTDTFTYTLSDGFAQTSTAAVTITVTPISNPDVGLTVANQPLNGSSVLANDSGTDLVVVSYTQGAHGTVVVNPDGTYTYTPAAGFSGTDHFSYVARDADGQLTVNNVDVLIQIAPVANPEDGFTPVNTVLNGASVLNNDNGTDLFVASYAQGSYGSVIVNADGTYVYTPQNGFSGIDTFTYVIQDASGQTTTGTTTVYVTPVANADTVNVYAGISSLAPSVLINDLGMGLSIASYTQGGFGSVVMQPNGTYTYTPQSGFSGTDSFSYILQDAAGQNATAIVTITVLPVAVDDTATAASGQPLNGVSVLSNDIGSGLAVASYTQPSHGTVTVNPDGTYVYTSQTGFSGIDVFSYTAQDISLQQATASVTITVTPVSNPDTGTTQANQTLNGISVLANDSGSNLIVTSYTQPSSGSVIMQNDGSYSYSPASNFSGVDSFNYTAQDSIGQLTTNTVTITVTPVANNDSGITSANTAFNGTSVLANDYGTALTVVSNTQGANGSVVMASDGTYVYTPVVGFSGTDSFTYTLQDGAGQSSVATVFINVVPVAVADTATTPANTPLNGTSLLADDIGLGLVIASYTQPAAGSVVVNADGTYVYTPQVGFSGYDSFTYILQDSSGQTAAGIVTIQVTPVVNDDNGVTYAGTALNGFNVLTNDIGTALTVTSYSQGTHGSVVVQPNGLYTYTPVAGFSGLDSFTYTVQDSSGQAASATVSMTINPVVVNDTATTPADGPLNGSSVLNNDTGTALTVTAYTQTSHGTLTVNSDGTYTYQPQTGFSGSDSFSYTAQDADGLTGTASVSIQVLPVARPDTATTAAGVVLNGSSLLVNDSGTALSVVSYTASSNGSVIVNPDGTYIYTPANNFSGTDSFTYTVQDASAQVATTSVTITVTPVATTGSGTTAANTTLNGASLLAQAQGSGLFVSSYTQGSSGTVIVNSDGTYIYTPQAGFSGLDTFTYTVQDSSGQTTTSSVVISVTPVAGSDTGNTTVDTPLNGSSLLSNDIGSGLFVVTYTSPVYGTVVVNADGTYLYTPAPGFSGIDTFSYTVQDSAGQTAIASVTIQVALTTDTISGTTPANTPLNGSSLLSGLSGSGLTITAYTQGSQGSVIINADGTYVYTPNVGFSGSDSFTYTVQDSSGQTVVNTVNVQVTPTSVPDSNTTAANTPLVGISVLANDNGTGLTILSYSQGTYGSITMNSDGTYTYTPNSNFSGFDTITYTAVDTSAQQTSNTLTISVIPIINADTGATAANTPLNGTTVLANDIGSGLSVISYTTAAYGTVIVNSDGTYVYTPQNGFSGVDTFTYTAEDSSAQRNSASVTVNVQPVANNDTGTTSAGTVLNGSSVLANDVGTALTVVSNTQGAHGSVVMASDGTYVYTPAATFSGTDTFTYTLQDSAGQTASAAVTVSILPVAAVDSGTTTVNTLLNGSSLLANDIGSGLNVISNTQAAHGVVSVNSDGSYSYQPANNFSGIDTFTYTIQDSSGQTASALVTITVTPQAYDDTATTVANVVLNGTNVLANDLGSSLQIVGYTQAINGIVVMNPDGTYAYTPNSGFTGFDSFSYTAADAYGLQTSASVTIEVTPAPSVVTTNVNVPITNAFPVILPVISTTQPTYGSVVLNGNNTYTYMPPLNFSGVDSFTYAADAGGGQTVEGTVTINVLPVAVDDMATTVANVSLTGTSVLSNDAGSNLAILSYTTPLHGTLTMSADGAYVYTPDSGYSGNDSFSYTAQDSSGFTTSANVFITVTPVIVQVQSGTTPANQPLSGSSVLDGSVGTGLSVLSNTQGAHGSVTVNSDGTYIYTPQLGFSGFDSFTYIVQDSSGLRITGTVNISVTPVSNTDSGTTTANTQLLGSSVLTNDIGSSLTVIGYSQPTYGSVVVAADGTYTYIPQGGFSGIDSFAYTAQDSSGQTTTNTVIVAVTPVTVADSATTVAGIELVGNSVLGDDIGTGLSVIAYTQPTYGSVVVNSDGTYIYTPQSGFSGLDSFSYTVQDSSSQTAIGTVNISVTPSIGVDSATVPANTVLNGSSVFANDIGAGLAVIAYSQPSHGTVMMNLDGTYIYTPDNGFSGIDTFTYTGQDGSGQTFVATVTITVTPVGVNDVASTPAGVVLNGVSLLANDAGSALTVVSNTQGALGTVLVNPDGTYIYQPQVGVSGIDSFTYTAQDANGSTFTATVTVNILPVANEDTAATAVNTVLNGSTVLANDLGTNLSVIDNSTPSLGVVVFNTDGTYIYTPNAGVSGIDQFTYTAQDGSGQIVIGTLTVTIMPIVQSDTGTTTANTTLIGSSLLANDQGSNLAVVAYANPAHGTVTVANDGTYTYVPNGGFSGIDTFTYTVQDAFGLTVVGNVTIQVMPVSQSDAAAGSANSVINGSSVFDNDIGTDLTIVSYTQGTLGTVVFNADGTYTYTPQQGVTGIDSFTYTAQDAYGLTTTNTVTIQINPLIASDTVTVPAGSVFQGASVLDNDVGTGLSITSYTQGAHGSVSMNADGTYTYTPVAGFSGVDTFTYSVVDSAGNIASGTVTVNVIPVAVTDNVSMDSGTVLNGASVLANDIGAGLTVISNTQGSRGTVVMAADGTYTYTPIAGFSGVDSFTYTLQDSSAQTAIGTVNIQVQPVANADTTSIPAGQTFNGPSVLGNDSGSGLTVISYTQGSLGSVVINPDGTYTYTPIAGVSGIDSFTYTVQDSEGQTTSSVIIINLLPVANDNSFNSLANDPLNGNVLANDIGSGLIITGYTSTANGTLVVNVDGSFTYVPNTGFSGTDSFFYTLQDAFGQLDSAMVTLTILPVAVEDTAIAYAETPLNGTSVLLNDLGTSLSVISNTQGAHGIVTMLPDGTYTYVPVAGFSGTDTFTYTVQDASGQTAIGTVIVEVMPVAGTDTATTPASTTLNGASVLDNDDGAGLSVTGYTQGLHGQVVVNSDGTYTYVPDVGYSGFDSFTYKVQDSSGQVTEGTVVISVTPLAQNDVATVSTNAVLQGPSVLTNDVGTGLALLSYTQPLHGTVIVQPGGVYFYSPDAGFSGIDTFSYTIQDSSGLTATATVTITVTALVNSDVGSVSANAILYGPSVLANDTGTGLSIISYTQGSHGSVVVYPDGTYIYAPEQGFSGIDTFTYTTQDASGIIQSATVTISVFPTSSGQQITTIAGTSVNGSSLLIGSQGTGLVVFNYSQGSYGIVTVNVDGTYTYTPQPGFSGIDTFTYILVDSYGQTTINTVTIEVLPVANTDTGTTSANVPLMGSSVFNNDSGTGLTIIGYTQPAHGVLVVNADGTYTYTPNVDYSGFDSFTYVAEDSTGNTVTSTVSIVVAPIALDDSATTPGLPLYGTTILVNDSGSQLFVVSNTAPENGTVIVNRDGTYVYTPNAGFIGEDAFMYVIQDSSGQNAVGTVRITVTQSQVIVVPDTGTTSANTPLYGSSVLANDTGFELTVVGYTQGAHGSVSMNADGTYIYIPVNGFSGIDVFEYTAEDGYGQRASTTVTITVVPVLGVNTGIVVSGETLRGSSVLANAIGTDLQVVSYTQPQHGTVVVNADGTYVYVSNYGYVGTDSFTYTAVDASGQSVVGIVTITVIPATPVEQCYLAKVNTPYMGPSLVVSGASLKDYTQPKHGSLVVYADGTFLYTPDCCYSGDDSFTYTLVDGTCKATSYTACIDVNFWLSAKEDPADPIYAPYSDMQLSEDYYPTVVFDGSQKVPYKMWHEGPSIALSSSVDGRNWKLVAETGLMGSRPYVLYDKNGFGAGKHSYKMWFRGDANQIYYSTSKDGIHWKTAQPIQEVSGASLTFSGSFDLLCGPGCILYNARVSIKDGQPYTYPYVMFYDVANSAETTQAQAIGLAYSQDGITWTRYGNAPIFIPAGGEAWDATNVFRCSVVHIGKEYHMFYSGSNVNVDPLTTVPYAHGIGHASSRDGLNWKRGIDKPIFIYSDDVAWRNSRTYTPVVLFDAFKDDCKCISKTLKMWFTGGFGTTVGEHQGIGYATWPCCPLDEKDAPPPECFSGCLIKNEFLNKTECQLKLRWKPSSCRKPVGYRIYKCGVCVAKVTCGTTLKHTLCLRNKDAAKGYSLTAVYKDGAESTPVRLKIKAK
jgi:VCBS repeat-containing protein